MDRWKLQGGNNTRRDFGWQVASKRTMTGHVTRLLAAETLLYLAPVEYINWCMVEDDSRWDWLL